MTSSTRLSSLLRPVALTAMVGCIALSLADLARLLVPTANSLLILAACLLAALEAHYAYGLVQARRLSGTELLRFRAIEYGFFFVTLKLLGLAGRGWPAALAEIQSWPRDPIGIFDVETTLAFLLAVLFSIAVGDTLHDLDRLDEPPAREGYYVSPMESLTGRFFVGGAALLVVAGLARLGLAALFDLARPSVPGLVLNVLVYFVLGLVLLGQVHYASLTRQWQAQGIRPPEDMPERWVRYTLAFLALAALLAFSLPTGYTLGMLGVVGDLLFAIATVLWFIFYLFTLPLAWLFSLLLGGGSGDQPGRPPLPPPPPVRPAGPVPPWLEAVRSLLFWAVVAGMITYVLVNYLRERPELLNALRRLGALRALQRLWAAARRRLGGLAEALSERLPRDLFQRLFRREGGQGQPRFFRLGGATPREQILFYYLSLVRRAREHGFGRRPAQTPFEYNQVLESQLPEARPEVQALTTAFVEARYSAHPAGPAQAQRARAAWQRIRAAFQALRRRQH